MRDLAITGLILLSHIVTLLLGACLGYWLAQREREQAEPPT